MEPTAFLRELTAFSSPAELLRRVTGGEPEEYQLDVLDADEDIVLVLASRGVGKSCVIALQAACYAETHAETTQLIICPGLRQAGELYRLVVQSRAVFEGAHRVTRFTSDTLELANGSRVICVPAVEQTIRGYRAQRVLIDEGCRVADETFVAALPMLTLGGQLFSCSTPNGPRGWFWELWQENKAKKITALATEMPRMSKLVELQEEKLSSPDFRQEVLCEFVGGGACFFSYKDVRRALIPGQELVLF